MILMKRKYSFIDYFDCLEDNLQNRKSFKNINHSEKIKFKLIIQIIKYTQKIKIKTRKIK
jgi:hypothetical protein